MGLSQADLAAKLDRSHRTIELWQKRGTLPRDPETMEAALLHAVNWFAAMRGGHAAPGGDGNVIDLATERAKLAAAQTEQTELKNAELRGELVRVDEIRSEWSRRVLTWKERVRAIPAAATVHVPGFTKTMGRALLKLIDEALTELADGSHGNAAGKRRARRGAEATPPAA